ncbi:MAG: hypothetical protein KDI79_30915 [Anaerolineae bacterium]|nr:hypothetical protein [Anaerolineae bacterium]
MNELITFLVGIAVAAGLFALGVVLYPKLAREKQGYPLEAQIEAVLLPYIFNAISIAFKTSERAVDDLQVRLKGQDKAAIANEVYKLLPDQIGGFDITLVKSLVPPDRFAQLVQDAYDRFDHFLVEHQSRFDELYESWKQASIS